MILRIFMALIRWAWGVEPAFYTPSSPLDFWDIYILFFAGVLDVVSAVVVAIGIVSWLESRE